MTSIKWIGCYFVFISKLRKIRMQFLLNYTKANNWSNTDFNTVFLFFIKKNDESEIVSKKIIKLKFFTNNFLP